MEIGVDAFERGLDKAAGEKTVGARGDDADIFESWMFWEILTSHFSWMFWEILTSHFHLFAVCLLKIYFISGLIFFGIIPMTMSKHAFIFSLSDSSIGGNNLGLLLFLILINRSMYVSIAFTCSAFSGSNAEKESSTFSLFVIL